MVNKHDRATKQSNQGIYSSYSSYTSNAPLICSMITVATAKKRNKRKSINFPITTETDEKKKEK